MREGAMGDHVHALRVALQELIGDPRARQALAAGADAAARGRYAWDAVARRTLALYRSLLGENPSS